VVPTPRRAFVVGSVSLDVVFQDSSRTGRVAVGNTAANIAVRLAVLGWDVCFCALAGLDEPGDLVARDLQRWQVNIDGLVRRRGYPTPHVFQRIDANGVALEYSNECPACGRQRQSLETPGLDELSDDVVGKARTAELFVTDLPNPVTESLAASAGGLVWYEASLREFSASHAVQLVRQCDVLKSSADEVGEYKSAYESDAARCSLQVVTEGSSGSRYRSREEGQGWSDWLRVAAVPMAGLVDAGGAGDAFTVAAAQDLAVCARPWSSRVVERALDAGSRNAAQACASYGARGDMPAPGGNGVGASVWISESYPVGCAVCSAGETQFQYSY
jgi:sugar/nucleoside kinase (ribokinase family)